MAKKIGLGALVLFMATGNAFAEKKKTKKLQTFTVERVLDIPADKVWAVVAEDYGAVAKSHPKIVSSDYIEGSLKGEKGAMRYCSFNEKGTQYLKETIADIDHEKMVMVNQVYEAGKFPVDPEYTRGTYRVVDLGNGKSKFIFDMEFRTKPAFMGGMMKGKFKDLISDYCIAIEHHVKTGEAVTKDNFKSIKKQYI